MPNIKSVKKDVKRSRALNARNISVKSGVKTLLKRARSAAKAGAQNLSALVGAAQKATDKAWQHGVIHKNKAARLKSRMAKSVNAASSQK